MQYCKNCRHICEDKLIVCPECKRPKSLAPCKDNDEVFFLRGYDYEIETISTYLEDNGIRCSVKKIGSDYLHNPFNSKELPDDKAIYVEFKDIESANALLSEYESNLEEEKPVDEMNSKKRIFLDILAVIAFMVLVSIVVFASDYVANGIRNFFMR